MKKHEDELNDWGRPNYKRSDLGKLVRGKYFERVKASLNVVVIDPEVPEVVQTSDAVNSAVRKVIKTQRATKKGESKAKQKRLAAPRKSAT